MENRGQSILMAVIVGVMLFMVGMIFLNFITPDSWVDGSDSMMTELGCGNSTNSGTDISDGVKATCLIGEIIIPYSIMIILSAVAGIILARFLV